MCSRLLCLNRLTEIWENLFSTPFDDTFSLQQCPLLIGIMRSSDPEKCWSSISEYEFTLLLKNDTIIRTNAKSTRETLLCELIIFKEKCDENEQILVSIFIVYQIERKYMINFILVI